MAEAEFDIATELEGKTLDVLARIVSDYEQGAVSQPQASFALQAVFNTTSGLVGDEVFNFISTASAEVNKDQGRDLIRRFFVNPEKAEMVLVEYQFGEAGVTLKRGPYPRDPKQVNAWERESHATFEHEANPFEAARVRFVGYADALTRAGFQEIK